MFKQRTNLLNIIAVILVPSILILHNFNYYKFLLLYKESYILFLLYLTIPLIAYLLVQRIFPQKKSVAALIVLLVTIFFFFFGTVQDLLIKYSFTRPFSKTYVLPFLFMLPVIYLIFNRAETRRFLRAISFIIIFFFLGELSLLFWNLKNFNEAPGLKEKITLQNNPGSIPDSFNIYHIVFDGYTNSQTLKELFGFQNPIDSFLVENGFYIAGRSKSNYNFTPYSFSATLNLGYLDLHPEHFERNYKNFFLGIKNYDHNLVFNFFRDKGYEVKHYSILDDYKHIDGLGSFAPRTPAFSMRYQTMERIFLNPWLWKKLSGRKENLPKAIRNNLDYYVQYNKNGFDFLLNEAAKDQKQFCFVHFFLPHEPYAFTRPGIDALTLADITNPQGYVEQVKQANEMIRKFITELKRNRHNIIIIQGDHGFRDFDFNKHAPLLQNAALNAFYFPDQDYEKLYDSISLVNTYRVILDQYFHQTLPLLKDEYFLAR